MVWLGYSQPARRSGAGPMTEDDIQQLRDIYDQQGGEVLWAAMRVVEAMDTIDRAIHALEQSPRIRYSPLLLQALGRLVLERLECEDIVERLEGINMRLHKTRDELARYRRLHG